MQLAHEVQPNRAKPMKGWQAARSPKVYSELITITPSMAIKMLHESNGANRPLSKYRVNVLAESIKRGEWITNSNAIGFDINGDLIDGQHRLNAIIQANHPVDSMVTYNLPPESFRTSDIGKSRSSGDIASILGMGKNARTVGSAANLLYYWKRGMVGKARLLKPTNTQVEHLLNANRGLEESASIGQSTHPALPPSVGAFCHYIFAQIDRQKADEFMEHVRTGANLPVGHPCLTLRNYMMEARINSINNQQAVIVAITIMAWNYFRHGRKIKGLRWKYGEVFPKPI